MSSHHAPILVTGGAGFIGSHVVDKLATAGRRPRVFDRAASSYVKPGQAETVIGDVLDPVDLRSAMHGCGAVVHLAAMADADDVARRPVDAERVNSQGTLNVLEAAREARVQRVIYASTIWAYSDVDAAVVDEDTPLVPPSHLYTATKVAGELYCRSYAELYDLKFTILRFGIPYGPRARPAAVLPNFVRRALAGEPLSIAGDGKQSRRFVYVEDLADGVVRALAPRAANRTYNLVSEEDVTIREVADVVASHIEDTEVVHVPGRAADFRGVEVSGQRAATELGWRASTPFATGVSRYIAWHQEEERNRALEPAKQTAGAWRRPLVSRLRLLSRPRRSLAFAMGILAMAVVFLISLDAGGYEDDLRTVSVTSLVGLLLYFAVSADPDAPPGPFSGYLRVGWLFLGGVLALAVTGPYNPLHLVHPQIELVSLSAVGAGLGVATGVAGRRLLRPTLRERPSDTAS